MRAYLGAQIARIKGHPIYAGISTHVGSHKAFYVLCFLVGLVVVPLLLGR